MLRPILSCQNPYETAHQLQSAGWSIGFSQPPESGDPLVGVSLFDNAVLLGVTEGYVTKGQMPYLGSGAVFYLTVPCEHLAEVHRNHAPLHPSSIERQPWGDDAFEIKIAGYSFMIAGTPES